MISFSSRQISHLIIFAIHAHAMQAKIPKKRFRVKTGLPYALHPLWGALMMVLEPKLPKKLQWLGFQVMLLHDVLEDTTASLPRRISGRVRHYISEMTFSGGFKEEIREVSKRDPFLHLLKLYDKVATLYDAAIEDDNEKIRVWIYFTRYLASVVRQHFGTLRIVTMAEQLCAEWAKHSLRKARKFREWSER